MTALTRRKAITAIAAAPAVVALPVPTMAETGPSELAALVRRYFEEVEAFNSADHATDEESNALAEATYEATLEQIIRTPARTQADALAVIEFMEKEDLIEHYWVCDDENVPASLVAALRVYLEGMAS